MSCCPQRSNGPGEETENRQWRETPGPIPASGKKCWMGSWPKLGGSPVGFTGRKLHFHSYPLRSAMSDWASGSVCVCVCVCVRVRPVCSLGLMVFPGGFPRPQTKQAPGTHGKDAL